MELMGAAILLVEIGGVVSVFGSAQRLASWVGIRDHLHAKNKTRLLHESGDNYLDLLRGEVRSWNSKYRQKPRNFTVNGRSRLFSSFL